MLLSKEILEVPRTASELQAFVALKRAEIEADPEERAAALHKRGLYKPFVEEIMQLSRLAEPLFGSEVHIRPVIGNQGFDAEILDECGQVLHRVEVTIPHDGDEAAKNARLLTSRGFGSIYTRTYGSSVLAPIFDRVVEIASQKAAKDYGDCTLIVVAASGFPAYRPEFDATSEQAALLVSALRTMPWKARRVVVDVPDICRFFEVYP